MLDLTILFNEICSELENSPTLIKFGLRDEYKISEDYSYILEENNSTADRLSEEI